MQSQTAPLKICCATTTSVLASGISPPIGQIARHGRQVSWLTVSDQPIRSIHGFSSPSRSMRHKRKGGRFVDKEASNPGRSLCHSSGFSGPFLFAPATPCGPPCKVIHKAGWKTLAALQSRGRLRLACPDGVHTFAFPFAFRPEPLQGRNHPSYG